MWRQKNYKNLVDYRNVKSHVYGGQSYHSKKEASYAAQLDILQKAGEIKEWDRQIEVPLIVNGIKIARYYVDFLVTHKDGRKEYVEVKGWWTDYARLKWRLFEALYSKKKNVELTVVK